MRYHAILFMCDDIGRAEWVSTNFKRHNPDIFLTVYNGGLDNRDVRARVAADFYEAGENLWHRRTRTTVGSFGYGWFEKLFTYAESRDAGDAFAKGRRGEGGGRGRGHGRDLKVLLPQPANVSRAQQGRRWRV